MPKRKPNRQLPPMELAIMHVLWEKGPSTVQQVQACLEGEPAYTTVQTIMNTMAHKKRVGRTLKGRAFVYRATLAQDAAMGGAVEDFIRRVFRGSVEGLLMNLLKTERVDAETLDRLRKLVAEREGESQRRDGETR